MQKNFSSLLFFLFALALGFVAAQERIDTTLNFNFANTIPKVRNCPAGAPRLPNDTLVEVKLGALVDAEGTGSSEGRQYALSMKVAVRELNSLLQTLNAPFFLTLNLQDTSSDPDIALKQFKLLVSEGIQVILGPGTSAELAALEDELALHPEVTVVSPGSTAIDLAKVDQIYRLFPNDKLSAVTLAAYLQKKNLDALIVFYRADLFGMNYQTGLAQALSTASPKTAIYPFVYTNDIVGALTTADSVIASAKLTNFGVVLISFDEWIPLVGAAANLPNLPKASIWIGPDLPFNDSPRPADPIADKTEVISVSVNIARSDISDGLRSAFLGLGVPLPRGAYFAYDSVYLALFSFIFPRTWNNPLYNFALNYAADHLYLSTGRVAFDENGDRALDAQFDLIRYRNGTNLVISTYSHGVFTDKKF